MSLFVLGGGRANAVSFHNFKSQNFKLSVSNPKSKYVAYLSVLSQISNCQGLGRKNKHEILKTANVNLPVADAPVPGARLSYIFVIIIIIHIIISSSNSSSSSSSSSIIIILIIIAIINIIILIKRGGEDTVD